MKSIWFFVSFVAAASCASPVVDNEFDNRSIRAQEELKFQITSSRSMNEPPMIQVTFSNGIQDEFELIQYKMNERSTGGCNYLGRLRKDPYSSVAVTGCINKPGDKMEVTLLSENNINRIFLVDIDGNAQVVKNHLENGVKPRFIMTDRNNENQWHKVGDEEVNDKNEEMAKHSRSAILPEKLKATIKFGYDEGFKKYLEDKVTNHGYKLFEDYIEAVFTQTQVYWRIPSLGTKVIFEVEGTPLYKPGVTWNAMENINDAKEATIEAGFDSGKNGVTVVSWWCAPEWEDNIAGVAYLGSLCQSHDTNICEGFDSIGMSGFILSHELAHNFGIRHDSGSCAGTGFMGKGRHRDWSTCSKLAFEHHYTANHWGDGCLQDISNTTTTSPDMLNEGEKCWNRCTQSGLCLYCGLKGMCCRQGSRFTESGCDGKVGGAKGHECTKSPSSETPVEQPDDNNTGDATTIQPNNDESIQNEGEECWGQCRGKNGNCSWCGGSGMCCRQGQNWIKGGCDGMVGGANRHECAEKPNSDDNLAWVEDGCPRAGKHVDGTFMPKDVQTCVRCCFDGIDGMTCNTPLHCGLKKNWMSYDDAASKCNETGKRLCKKEELLSNLCCGKGGGGDNWPVWAL